MKETDKKVRVLYFVDYLQWGGIQSLLYDIVRHIDKKHVSVSVLTLDDGVHYSLEDRLKEAGVQVIQLKGIWNARPKDFVPYIKTVKHFFKAHYSEYDVIHMNSSCKNAWILYYAKKYGIRIRIAHSHNTGFTTETLLAKTAKAFLTPFLKHCATHFLACSENAGRWMFGDKCVRNGRVKIIKNAIDTDAFVFNPEWRKSLRGELHIGNNVVYGCVGRLENQKNHKFLIQVFSKIKQSQSDAILLLVGDGSLEKILKKQVDDAGLTDSVIFTGFKTNRNQYMSAMDSFIVTSFYEGFSIVTIEAQAAGLPCFVPTGVIPYETKITNLITFIDPSDSAASWADKILSVGCVERHNMSEAIIKSGCDMETMIKELTNVYKS